MKILVVGSSGFIARHFWHYWGGHHELISVGRSKPEFVRAVDHVELNLSRHIDVSKLPRKVDAVLYLAQSDAYRNFPDGAEDMFKVNVQSVFELLEYARKSEVSNFVFASTGSVYSESSEELGEDDYAAPDSFYSASKLSAEALIRPYGSVLNTCIFRLFSPYGPGQTGKLMNIIADRIRSGQPVTLQGREGGMLFSPTYVRDVVEILGRAIAENWSGVWNLANPHVVDMREYATCLAGVLNSDVSFERDESALAPKLVPSIDRLQAQLGAYRFTPLINGLQQSFI
ncbi:MAG: NAD(P)-dependent oxidoreductase [Parvibaculaceae bacterium]|nr:NAD(P)-dependent oxidoreductase [Parvibaculaceae bacterium]